MNRQMSRQMNRQMNNQPVPTSAKSRLLAGSLLVLSTCGTLSLFGAVPLMARLLSASTPPSPHQAQEPQPAWQLSRQPPLHLRPRS